MAWSCYLAWRFLFGFRCRVLGVLNSLEYSPIMKKQCDEGTKAKAKEKFERTMTALFQVLKPVVVKKIKKKTKKGKD